MTSWLLKNSLFKTSVRYCDVTKDLINSKFLNKVDFNHTNLVSKFHNGSIWGVHAIKLWKVHYFSYFMTSLWRHFKSLDSDILGNWSADRALPPCKVSRQSAKLWTLSIFDFRPVHRFYEIYPRYSEGEFAGWAFSWYIQCDSSIVNALCYSLL